MKRFIKKFHYGQKGFTLIELLVVVAILGVLAAVAVPNITKFMGSGTVEAANTEAHNVQTAVVAYMVDNSRSTCTGSIGPGPGEDIEDPVGPPPDISSVKDFLTGNLQACYQITDGEIVDAVLATPTKWKDLVYTPGVGWVKQS